MEYDMIIVGSGSVGSAAGYYAARAGTKVLMIDSGTPPHKDGSHHGDTRLIRCAYGEGAKYVPLVLRSEQLWKELGRLSGMEIMQECGVLNMGANDSSFIVNAQKCVKEFNLHAEILSSEEVHKRWPAITPPENFVAVFEPKSGLLKSELAIDAYVKLAKQAGAQQLFNTEVTAVKPIANGVEVTTSAGKFRSRKAVVSAGTWVRNIFPEMPIEPLRKVYMWHKASEGYKDIPGFIIAFGDYSYYGFPSDGIRFKVGRHRGGQIMKTIKEYLPYGEVPEDKTELLQFLRVFMRGVGEVIHGETCTYDMSPDEDFIVDTLPGCSNVMVVTGLSGHGFKFASALGEVAAMFGRDQQSSIDLSAFRLDRFKRSSHL